MTAADVVQVTDSQLEQLFDAAHEHGEYGREFREHARHLLAAPPKQAAPVAPAGWRMVPVEPTQAMCQEGQWKAKEWPTFPLRIVPIWKAMIDAAPQPAPQPAPPRRQTEDQP